MKLLLLDTFTSKRGWPTSLTTTCVVPRIKAWVGRWMYKTLGLHYGELSSVSLNKLASNHMQLTSRNKFHGVSERWIQTVLFSQKLREIFCVFHFVFSCSGLTRTQNSKQLNSIHKPNWLARLGLRKPLCKNPHTELKVRSLEKCRVIC